MSTVTESLSLVSQSCTDALAVIGTTDNADPGPLRTVIADLDALLALVYHTATKLALAPLDATILPILADLASHPPALAHCTRLLHVHVHGAALVKDVRSCVTDIIDALRALVQTFLSNAVQPANKDYLVKTAALHDLIANARGPAGIPKDNQTAVYRAWKSDRDALEDGLQEIASMINDAQSDDIDDINDGWNDIGIAHSTRMGEHELARANNVHQLLRLTTLLHRRIFLDLLAYPSSAPVSALDALLAQSNLLLSTSDDLVSALYTPQDQACVHALTLELANIATTLQLQLSLFLPATDQLTDQLRALSVDQGPPSSSSKKKAGKKWFDTCVDQIVRLSSTATQSSE